MFLTCSNRRGPAYWIFIFWTGKFDFRLTSNKSPADKATSTKFRRVKEDHFCQSTAEFAPAAVRRSAARGPKRKTFTPKFLENGPDDRRHFCTADRARREDGNT